MNYIQQAMRTNSPLTGTFHVHADLVHATFGLMDEVLELIAAESITNAKEELGDICWFVALAAQAIGSDPFVTTTEKKELSEVTPLIELVHGFISHVKKAYAYGAFLDTLHLGAILQEIVEGVQLVAKELAEPDDMEKAFRDLLALNIAKLKVRFPEKFTSENALNRNLGSELAALETNLQ